MAHFFDVLSLEEIINVLKSFKKDFDSKRNMLENEELVELIDADNRVLARAIRAKEDLPLSNRSAMDGYAVHAKDTFGASESNPMFLKNVMNFNIDDIPEGFLNEGECAGVVTGGIPPQNADAIVMVEYTEELGNNMIEIRKSVAPYSYMMLQGEDVKANAIALEKGTFLKAQEIGMLAAMGVTHVPVVPKMEVAIISTGDEVQPIETNIRKGQVRDVNSYTLAALVKKVHAKPIFYGIVNDKIEELQEKLKKALEAKHDIVLLSGGSSVGMRDFTVEVLKSLPHCEILCHGIAMSPGKPVIFAKYKDILICGLPGQVTSAQVVMKRLILPYIEFCANNQHAFELESWHSCKAILDRNIASKHGREDYIRVAIYKENNTLYAKPILGHSGLLKTLLASDGLVQIDAKSEGLENGLEVDVLLFD